MPSRIIDITGFSTETISLDVFICVTIFVMYSNFDEIFGLSTKNVLCHPLRANRGGGRVIGVLEMTNKHNNGEFDSTDVDIMADCARRVSDDLHIRFRELLQAAEMLQGKSELVTDRSVAYKRYDAPTAASISGQYDRESRLDFNASSAMNPRFAV
jgi:hypothetical protein